MVCTCGLFLGFFPSFVFVVYICMHIQFRVIKVAMFRKGIKLGYDPFAIIKGTNILYGQSEFNEYQNLR